MNRKVNIEVLREHIDKHDSQGVERLAVAAGCSASLIRGCLRGEVPASPGKRRGIARAMKRTEDFVFPLLEQGKEQAS